jgi:hypothetical protein
MALYKIGKTQNFKNRLLKYNTDKEVYQVNIEIIKNFINKCGDIAEMNFDIHLKEKNKCLKGGDYSNYYIALYKSN